MGKSGKKKAAPSPPPVTTSKTGRSAFSWVLLFNAIVVMIAAGGWFLYQNQHLLATLPRAEPPARPWAVELSQHERESTEAALAWIGRSKLQYDNDPFLLCKEAQLHARQGEYQEFVQSLTEAWSTAKEKEPVGQEIIQLARKVYTHQPHAIAGFELAQLLQEVGQQVKSPHSLHLASLAWAQIHDWRGCEMVAREGIAMLQETSTSSRSLPARLYDQLLTALMEQHQNEEALLAIRALYQDANASWVTNNWRMLELYGEILLRTSRTHSQLDTATHSLGRELSKATASVKASARPAKASAFYALAQLYDRRDKFQMARDIMQSQWVEFWDAEVQSGQWDDKGYLPRFMANMTAEEFATPLPVSELSAEDMKRRFHTNLKVLSGQTITSRKVEQPFSSHPLTGYTLPKVQVQTASGDPRVILAGSDNRLHGFANMLASKPPYGLLPVGEKKVVPVQYGILLHWKPSEQQYWIAECLPKLMYLIENDWMGEYEATLLLTPSAQIQEYLELLNVDDLRVSWLRKDTIYEVEKLAILDFLPATKNVIGVPHPPLPLIQTTREELIGNYVAYEDLDVVLVVRDPTVNYIDTNTLISDLTQAVEEIQQQGILENLQVVEIDPHGPVYRQMFAYRRARVLVVQDSNYLANCMWMSPRGTILQITPDPIQETTALVMAAQLGLDYRVIVSSGSADLDLLGRETPAIQDALRTILS